MVHHTDCGMGTFTDEIMRGLLDKSLETATFDDGKWRDEGKGTGSVEGRSVNRLTIRSQAESIREDVERIRAHPLVSRHIPIHGYLYDGNTGLLREIPEATNIGKAV